jgi:hypothetical protein
VAIGGNGGAGRNAGEVAVDNNIGGILTRGDNAVGIFAQSVVGGGGAGAGAVADGSGGSVNFNLGLGGHGGVGGDGGDVAVANSGGAILTGGADAPGILAQSVGGGGGAGGRATSGAGTGPQVAAADFVAKGMGIGAGVTDLGNGIYELQENARAAYGDVSKLKQIRDSYNAQNPADPVTENKESSSSFTLDVGGGVAGKGGAAGHGGDVTVANTGDIETTGPSSAAVFAQSVGGGGGAAGITNASSSDSVAESTVTGSFGVGGNGGSSGSGGNVAVTSTGSMVTAGDLSYGVHAQSIGGGGGKGGASTATGATFSAFSLSLGGEGGSNGNGATVSVDLSDHALITTAGNDAAGILAQSVGGGGTVIGNNNRGNSLDTLFPASGMAGSGGALRQTLQQALSA